MKEKKKQLNNESVTKKIHLSHLKNLNFPNGASPGLLDFNLTEPLDFGLSIIGRILTAY